MDGRSNNGGKREGAGRKPKADEQQLIEKLTPLAPKAFKALENAVEEEQSWAVRMYFEYMYGKPKERIISENFNHSVTDLTPEERDAKLKELLHKANDN